MVAVFTGLGAGFERGSAAQIGSAGLLGGGVQGRGGDRISVNAATGNLLINRQDEFLVGRGHDVGISRTYNSLGALDENGDHWRQSTDRRIISHTGTANTNGATVKRISADGSEVTYTYHSTYTGTDINGNVKTGVYRATDGSGAHDSLVYASSKWTWSSGDSSAREVYYGTGGYIREQIDQDGNKVTFTYSGTKLTKVTTADGGYLQYVWSGNNISRIDTYAGGTGTSRSHIRTRYAYDGQNRLTSVTTDLTLNSSISDGKVYTTNYTYHGSTKRIASITQTDGSQVNFTYDGSGRVYDITQIPGNGEPNRITKVRYGSGYTDVYDPSGTRSILYHNAKKELTRSRIYAPAQGIDYSNYFFYDSSGNVTRVQDAEGQNTYYTHDTRGNVLSVKNQAGITSYNVYDARNNLTRVQSLASNAASGNAWQYTRFVYDAEDHLRYSITAEGHVTEYRYEGAAGSIYGEKGDHRLTLSYTDNAYAIGSAIPTLGQMNAWRDGLADRSNTQIYENRFDAKGNIASTVKWASASSTGGIIAGEGWNHTLQTHDSSGRILTQYTSGLTQTNYTYDGLGRTIRTTDQNGGVTTIVFNDAATKTVVTSAGGYVTTSVYNKAGNLIDQMRSGSFDHTIAENTADRPFKYDKNGRLRVSRDATGYKTYYVYDKAGNLTAQVDGAGFVQEFRYDKNGRQIAHARYTRYKATAARTAMLATLADPNNTLEAKDLRHSVDQAANHHSYDIWQWTAYDAKGQVIRTALGDGSVTTYTYDNAGRLIATKSYVNKLNSAQLVALRAETTDLLDTMTLPAANAKDVTIRTFYNRDGLVVGTLNGDGYLARNVYDEAGRVIQQSAYANKATNLTGTFNQVYNSVTKSSAKDAHTRFVYDGQGNIRFTIDALGKVTENVYKVGGNHTAIGLARITTQHYATLGNLANYKLGTVKAAVTALGSKSSNRNSWAVYNTRAQLVYSIDSTGSVTRLNYDTSGRVTKTTQYATARATTSLPTEGQMNSWAGSNAANARINRTFYTASGLVKMTVDAEGYLVQNDYDKEGRLYSQHKWTGKVTTSDSSTTSSVYSARNGTYVSEQYRYDHQGRLSSVYDANGTRNYMGYYANGALAWEISAYGHGTEQESRVLHINDAAGRTYVTRQYTGSYYDTADADYREYRQTYTYYDGTGNVSRVREYRGNHNGETSVDTPDQNTYFYYDKRGNVIQQTNAEGGKSYFTYNAFGQVLTSKDPKGYVTTNTYDKGGRLTRTTDALNYHTDFTYTAFNEQATVKRNNATTTFAYDKLGQVTRVTDALGKYEQYTYDAFGQQASVRNKLGGYTYNTYDKRGQMTQSRVVANVYNHVGTRVATDIINKYEYDSRGNQTKMIEAYGRTEARTTTYVYDKADQLIQKKGDVVSIYTSGADSSAANVTPTEYYTYDRRGNLIESKDANGARTLYFYDSMDRVTHQISPEGTLVRNFYDANSNLMETRVYGTKVGLPANALGTPSAGSGTYRRTTFTYDRLNRMTNSYVHDVQTAKFGSSLAITATTNDLRTQYQYDANGNVIKVIDPNGGETRSEYDKLNRKTRQYDAGNFRTDWAYNADGNVTRETRFGTGADPHRYTDFTYDKNGNRLTEKRLSVKIFNGSTGETTAHSQISYLYNALGQVTRKTEATGEYIDYAYDAQGRLNYETRSAFTDHLGGSVRSKVQYLYNGLNDVSRVYKYGKNGSISHSDSHYVYAKGGRLTTVTDGNGFVRTYGYDAKGQMVREEYARVTNGATQIEGIGYDFNKEGRVTAQGAVVKSGSTWSRGGNNLDTVNTQYNAFGDVSARGINGKYSERMEYDKAGRLWRTTSGDGAYKYFMHDNNGNQTLVFTSDGRNIDNKTIAQILAIWGVSSNGANANRISTDYETDITATITKYDARNLAIEVREPEREHHNSAGTKIRADFITKRGYNAFGEVISETDANNQTINYTYNTMGRRTRVQSPTVSITGTNGAKSNVRPTEYYYYDISGRLVASKDANGNLTKQTLLAGTGYNGSQALITKTTAADLSTVTTAYDMQGNARKITDQLGRVTLNSFDKMGNLTQINHASGLIDYYSYDGLGQQYKHWNNVAVTASYYDKITGTTIPGGPDFASTDYDAQGRIVVQRAIGGDITATSYVFSGTGVLATNGGWLQTTTLANGKQSKVYKDVFNKAIRSYDLSNRQVNYTYDKGGRMTQVSGAGADTQNYYYLNTNKLDKMTVTGSNYDYSYFDASSFTRTTTYGYDKVGNLTKEQLKEHTVVTHTEVFYEDYWGGGVPETFTWTENKYTTLQNAKATYDALGRLKTWNELGTVAQSGYTSKTPAASKVFEYDAQGNIRRTVSTHKTLDAQGVASTANTVKDTWYKFDSMNRITTAEGQLVGGQIVRGSTGVDIAYDAAGQRKYTLKDTVSTFFNKATGTTTTTTTTNRENYTYNTAGQVTQVRTTSSTTGTPGTGGTLRSSMTYDLMGRQTRQLDYDAAGTNVVYDSTKVYNNKSHITNETTITKRSDGTYKNVTTNAYGTPGTASYALGAATTVTTANYKNNSYQVTSRTTNTYTYYNGASLASTSYDSNTGSSSNPLSSTAYSNSKSGVLISARVSDGRARTVSFTVDNQGQTIRRDEKDHKTGGDPHEIWYRFGGKEMGYVGNNGTYNTAFAQSITDRTTTPTSGTNAGAFKHGRTTGTSHANFDQAYQAINSYKQGSSAGSYTVRSGDTLQGIAANIYGDSSLWYKIAAANGMTGEATLIEGQSLILPSGVVKSTHNASSFKPYSPGDIQGDLNPTTPHPQNGKKGKKCGVLGAILLVVVAVVVTLATAGAFAAAITPGLSLSGGVSAAFSAGGLAGATIGTGAAATGIATSTVIAAGVVGAAAGSIASQAVGVATGIQEKFSWKNVALAALSAGVTAGLGDKALNAFGGVKNTALQAGLRASAGSAISQGIGVATGLQDKFSFAGVAAAGVGAAAASAFSSTADKFGKAIGRQFGGGSAETYLRVSQTATKALTGAAAAVANAATRSAIEGSSFGDNIVAAIPDVIGNALVNYASACFSANTSIHTPVGMRRIDDIKVGDWVYSRDENFKTNSVRRNRVTQLFRYENRATLDVTISFEDGSESTLRTTSEHPFAVIDNNVHELIPSMDVASDTTIVATSRIYSWRAAGDLSVGDRAVDINNRVGLVTEIVLNDGLETVYNFSVDGDHTYFVGDVGVWVHNDYGAEFIDKIMRALGHTPRMDIGDSRYNSYDRYGAVGVRDFISLDSYGKGEQARILGFMDSFELSYAEFDDFKNGLTEWVGKKWDSAVELAGELNPISVALSMGEEYARDKGYTKIANAIAQADGFVEGVIKGVGDGVGNVIGGIGTMILNPVDTVSGIMDLGVAAYEYGKAVKNGDASVLSDLGALGDAYVNDWINGYDAAVATGKAGAGTEYVTRRTAGIFTEIASVFLGGAGLWSKIGKLKNGKNLSRMAKGIVFEAKAVKAAAKRAFLPNRSVQRLSVRAYGPNGKLMEGRTVLDQAGFRKDTGEFGALEFKLSKDAPYTKRQKEHFPNLLKYGGEVVGNNGRAIGMPAGFKIDPVGVVRHNGPKIPKVWW